MAGHSIGITHPNVNALSLSRSKNSVSSVVNKNNTLGKLLRHGWIFKGSLTKDLLHDKDATLVGTTIFLDRNAATFNGGTANHRLNLGAIPTGHFLMLQQPTTVVVRVFIDYSIGTSSFPHIIEKADAANGNNGWSLRVNVGEKRLQLQYDNVGFIFSPSNSMLNTGWYNIAFWVDGSSDLYLWVEGEEVGSDIASANYPPDIETDACIGNINFSSGRTWRGKIDYIYMFESMLSQKQIQDVWRDPYQMLVPTIPQTFLDSTVTQAAFRWGADDNTEALYSFLEAQNINISRNGNLAAILRYLVDTIGDTPSMQLKIQVRRVSGPDSEWRDVPIE